MTDPASIDDYIAGFPPAVQSRLEEMRTLLREALPEAEETISYKMPTLATPNGSIHFAGYAKHIGLYPTPNSDPAWAADLAPYAHGKGTARFAIDEPLPADLVRRLASDRFSRLRKG